MARFMSDSDSPTSSWTTKNDLLVCSRCGGVGLHSCVCDIFDREDTKPEAVEVAKVRHNGYAAKCRRCRALVPKDAGSLTKEGGEWVVRHIGDCPPKDTFVPSAPRAGAAGDTGTTSQVDAPVERVEFSVPDGRYTIEWEDGTYKTIRVRTQESDASFMPGVAILGFLSGSDNTSSYTSFAHVANGEVRVWMKHSDNASLREAVKVLLGDPKAASKAYASLSGSCGVCGRDLTTPESLGDGIGPTCKARLGW